MNRGSNLVLRCVLEEVRTPAANPSGSFATYCHTKAPEPVANNSEKEERVEEEHRIIEAERGVDGSTEHFGE